MSDDSQPSVVTEQDDDSNPPQLSPQTREVKKRRSYTIDQKLEVVAFAKSTSRNAASRKFNIARHCVSQWMRSEDELVELQASTSEMPAKRRRPGAGRHVKNGDLDDQVADWIRGELAGNRQVLRFQVQDKALEIYQKDRIVNLVGREFKASTGWLEKFLLRHNFQSSREGGIFEASASTSTSSDPSPQQNFPPNLSQGQKLVGQSQKSIGQTTKPLNQRPKPLRHQKIHSEDDLNDYEEDLNHMSSNDFLHKIIEEVNQELESDGDLKDYIKESVSS